jgi:hypothetical protein
VAWFQACVCADTETMYVLKLQVYSGMTDDKGKPVKEKGRWCT